MIRTARLTTLLVAGMVLTACNSDSRQIMDQAEARWRKGQYEDAIRLNNFLYERDPRGKYAAEALMNIGNIYYLNLRQLDRAIDFYGKLVQELPQSPKVIEARLAMADIYANELGDLTQAIFEYDRILEWDTIENREEIRFRRANTYFEKEDFHRALRELRRLEETGIGGHLADQVSLKIGTIYLILKRFEDAAVAFEKVIRSPCVECRNTAIRNLMEAYEDLYDFDRAIETIRKLDASPENEEHINREVMRLNDKRHRIESGQWSIAKRDSRGR